MKRRDFLLAAVGLLALPAAAKAKPREPWLCPLCGQVESYECGFLDDYGKWVDTHHCRRCRIDWWGTGMVYIVPDHTKREVADLMASTSKGSE